MPAASVALARRQCMAAFFVPSLSSSTCSGDARRPRTVAHHLRLAMTAIRQAEGGVRGQMTAGNDAALSSTLLPTEMREEYKYEVEMRSLLLRS